MAFEDADLVAQHQQLGLISVGGVLDEEEHGRRLVVAGLGGPPPSSDGLSAPHTLSKKIALRRV
jgi:hypothetical protein